MRWPLVVLAVPAALLGLVGLPSDWLPTWLSTGEPVVQPDLHIGFATTAISALLTLAGALTMWLVWRREPAADPSRVLGRRRPALVQAFYVDDFYDRTVVRATRWATGSVSWTDDSVVVPTVLGSGRLARTLAALVSRTEGGNITAYLTGLLAGVLLVVAGVVVLT
jgi:NADH-quinone oxidoreductase subunit L